MLLGLLVAFACSTPASAAAAPELAVAVGSDLVMVAPDGTRQLVIRGGAGLVSFTPAGDEIVYPRTSSDGASASLHVRRLEGDADRRLTDPHRTGRLPVIDGRPAVSPDGALVAFIRDRGLGGGDRLASLLVMPLTGGRPRSLARVSYRVGEQIPILDVAWSPDGTTLAAVVDHQAVLFSRTGTRLRTLSAPGTRVNSTVSWAPDGSELALAFWREDEIAVEPQPPEYLAALPPQGGPPRLLLTCTLGCSEPAWSPDGQWIAVADNTGPDGPEGPVLALRILNAESGAVRWSSNARQLLLRDQPLWSPDSRYLAYYLFTSYIPFTPRQDTAILDTTTGRLTAVLHRAYPLGWRP